MLNLMTAIYWGQLSNCMTLHNTLAGYSCDHPTAYGAVCFFSVMLFLIQGGFTYVMYKSRGEFINESGLYDDISGSSNPVHEQEGGVSYANSKFAPVSQGGPGESADL